MNFLPGTLLISKLCPKGIETTVFAMLAAYHNFGMAVSPPSLLGAFFCSPEQVLMRSCPCLLTLRWPATCRAISLPWFLALGIRLPCFRCIFNRWLQIPLLGSCGAARLPANPLACGVLLPPAALFEQLFPPALGRLQTAFYPILSCSEVNGQCGKAVIHEGQDPVDCCTSEGCPCRSVRPAQRAQLCTDSARYHLELSSPLFQTQRRLR